MKIVSGNKQFYAYVYPLGDTYLTKTYGFYPKVYVDLN